MRDQQDRPGIISQDFLQNFLGGQVKMVGGLVQQEQIGIRKRQFCQRQPSSLAAAERRDAVKDLFALKTITSQIVTHLSRQKVGHDSVDLLDQVAAGVKVFVRLGKIAHLKAGAQLNFAAKRRKLP